MAKATCTAAEPGCFRMPWVSQLYTIGSSYSYQLAMDPSARTALMQMPM